jgi:hypothetical protein
MMSLIEKYEARGLELKIDEEKITAVCTRPTKRARLGYKTEFAYRYGTVARMFEHIEQFLIDLERADQYKQERKIARAAAKSAALESVKEGDIYVASWGWEQTNIDAYQVVARKGATVTLREIGLESIEGSEGFMSDRVRPVKDAFIGNEFKKRITGAHINIDDVRMASLVTESEKDFYRSWYA